MPKLSEIGLTQLQRARARAEGNPRVAAEIDNLIAIKQKQVGEQSFVKNLGALLNQGVRYGTSLGASGAAAIADALNADQTEASLEAIAKQYKKAAERYDAPPEYSDISEIGGLGDLGRFAAGTIASGIGSAAPIIGAGAAGLAAGAVGAPSAAATGLGVGGAGALSYLLGSGDVRQAQQEALKEANLPDDPNPAISLGLGGLYAATELAGPVAGTIPRYLLRNKAAPQASRGLLQRMGTQGLQEAATEGTQRVITDTGGGLEVGDPGAAFTPENLKGALKEAAAGFAPGAAFGVFNPNSAPPPKQEDAPAPPPPTEPTEPLGEEARAPSPRDFKYEFVDTQNEKLKGVKVEGADRKEIADKLKKVAGDKKGKLNWNPRYGFVFKADQLPAVEEVLKAHELEQQQKQEQAFGIAETEAPGEIADIAGIAEADDFTFNPTLSTYTNNEAEAQRAEEAASKAQSELEQLQTLKYFGQNYVETPESAAIPSNISAVLPGTADAIKKAREKAQTLINGLNAEQIMVALEDFTDIRDKAAARGEDLTSYNSALELLQQKAATTPQAQRRDLREPKGWKQQQGVAARARTPTTAPLAKVTESVEGVGSVTERTADGKVWINPEWEPLPPAPPPPPPSGDIFIKGDRKPPNSPVEEMSVPEVVEAEKKRRADELAELKTWVTVLDSSVNDAKQQVVEANLPAAEPYKRPLNLSVPEETKKTAEKTPEKPPAKKARAKPAKTADSILVPIEDAIAESQQEAEKGKKVAVRVIEESGPSTTHIVASLEQAAEIAQAATTAKEILLGYHTPGQAFNVNKALTQRFGKKATRAPARKKAPPAPPSKKEQNTAVIEELHKEVKKVEEKKAQRDVVASAVTRSNAVQFITPHGAIVVVLPEGTTVEDAAASLPPARRNNIKKTTLGVILPNDGFVSNDEILKRQANKGKQPGTRSAAKAPGRKEVVQKNEPVGDKAALRAAAEAIFKPNTPVAVGNYFIKKYPTGWFAAYKTKGGTSHGPFATEAEVLAFVKENPEAPATLFPKPALKEVPLDQSSPDRYATTKSGGKWHVVDKDNATVVSTFKTEKAAVDKAEQLQTEANGEVAFREYLERGGTLPDEDPIDDILHMFKKEKPTFASTHYTWKESVDVAAIRTEIDKIAKRILPKEVNLSVALEERLNTNGSVDIYEAPYGSLRAIVELSLGNPNVIRTAHHEFFHILARFMDQREWNILKRRARVWMKRYQIDQRYAGDNLTYEELVEEATADAFAYGSINEPAAIRRAFFRVRNFFERVGNALRGLGYRSADDVFNGIHQGKMTALHYKKRRRDDTNAFIARKKEIASTNERVGELETKIGGPRRIVQNLFDVLGTLPNKHKFQRIWYKTAGMIANSRDLSTEAWKLMGSLPTDQRRAIFDYFNTRNATPPVGLPEGLATRLEQMKTDIRDIGRELVELGMISEEAYAEMVDRYIPYVYFWHQLSEEDQRKISTQRKTSDLGYIKHRDPLMQDMERLLKGQVKNPGFLLAKVYGQTARDIALLKMLNYISEQTEWVWPSNLAEYQGMPVTVQWLRNTARDIRNMAEKGAYETAEDKATALEQASVMETLAAETGDVRPLENYRQVPESKRYGKLGGMWVRREIYEALIDSFGAVDVITEMMGEDYKWLGRGVSGLTQAWKAAKVPFNIPSIARNMGSALVMMHVFADMPMFQIMKWVPRAIKAAVQNGELWQLAKTVGVKETTYSAAELNRIGEELLRAAAEYENSPSAWRKVWMTLLKGANSVTDFYGKIDAVLKTAVIGYYMEKGLDAQDAAIVANDSLFDYQLVSREVRALRTLPIPGAPFITFTLKMLPQMYGIASGSTANPSRIMKLLTYGVLPLVFSAMTAAVNDMDEDDVATLRAFLPDHIKDNLHTFPVPIKMDDGSYEFLDLGYYFPWQPLIQLASTIREGARTGDMGKAVDAVQGFGLFSSPITDPLFALLANKDMFTGRDIRVKETPISEQLVQVGNYVTNFLLPPMFSDLLMSAFYPEVVPPEYGGAFARTYAAASGRLDRYTRQEAQDLHFALPSLVGFNFVKVLPREARTKELLQRQKEIALIQSNATRKLQEPNLLKDQERWLEIRDTYVNLIKRKADEARRFAEATGRFAE